MPSNQWLVCPSKALDYLNTISSDRHQKPSCQQHNCSYSTGMAPKNGHIPSYAPYRDAQRYQYRPLNAARNEIRLIRLLYAPTVGPLSSKHMIWIRFALTIFLKDTLRCEIFHTTVENAPEYHALSYAWGDASVIKPLHVHVAPLGTEVVFVTLNLRDALWRLIPKNPTEELVIWVDAICINQQDIPERNIQTGKMRMIYENAEKLLVWIGLENQGSSEALKLARDLNACSPQEATRLIQLPDTSYALESLVRLFRRQYWWRIWVIQEVSCAKQTTVFCGEETIPWTELETVCDIMRSNEEIISNQILYPNLSKVRTLTHGGPRGLQLSRFSPQIQNPPLLDLLLSHKSKNSTEPKDKVYALVGISNSSKTFGQIDYSLSLREVYTHTAQHIITTSQKLDVICAKQHNIERFNLPSWVVDWRRRLAYGGNSLVGLHNRQPPFAAAGNTNAAFAFSHGGYVLRAQGVAIDRITALGITFKKRGNPANVIPVLGVYDDWRKLFTSHRGRSAVSDVEFGKAISGGYWQFDDTNTYSDRLRLISILSTSHIIRHSAEPDQRASQSEEWEITDDVQIQKNITPGDEMEAMTAILSASLMMNRRRLFVTERSITGLAPWDAEVGDLICVLLGCRFPVVLREREGLFELIGEAYVTGHMDGEIIVGLDNLQFSLDTFEIH
jgi:hypothetical protein